ncbi:MAG: hypothetical protein M1830_006412 [Pleopsidium flavum]|nr:MAG: hypothetical protein M1830_006412 [Pleopsidium flavum]
MPMSRTSGSLPGQNVFQLWSTKSDNMKPPRTPSKSKHLSAPIKSTPSLTRSPHLPDSTAGTIPPPLPPSVEMAYRNKCIDLKRRMSEVEESNDAYRLRKVRLMRGIRKMRLQRAFLLEALAKRMKKTRRHTRISNGGHNYDDESEGSSGGPPTPQEKPLRTKRGHRRPSLPVLLPSPSPQQDLQRGSSGYILSPRPPDPGMIPQYQQLATTAPLQRACEPHSSFTATNLSIPHLHSTTNITNGQPTGPPVRPIAPYDSFAMTAYPQYTSANPAAEPAQITAVLQQAWRELGPSGQRPFVEAYEAKMQEYQAERDEYRARNRHTSRNTNSNGNGHGSQTAAHGTRGGDNREQMEREVEGRGGEDVEMDGAAGAGGFTAVNG